MHNREHQLDDTFTADDTFEWIWDEGWCSCGFREWLEGSSELFWISGAPGSGKSTLMNYLARAEETKGVLGSAYGQEWLVCNFYFDFRGGQGLANDLKGLFRSLLFQLTGELPAESPVVQQLGSILSRFSGNPSVATLRKNTAAITSQSGQDILLLVDGLDEFCGDFSKAISLLTSLTRSADPKVKLCIASRPNLEIEQNLVDCDTFQMQRFNGPGVRKYIASSKLRTIRQATTRQADHVHLDQLEESLNRRAQGIYLWVRCVLEDLYPKYCNGCSHRELLQALEQIPKDLDDTYHRVLRRLSNADLIEASFVLRILGAYPDLGNSTRGVDVSSLISVMTCLLGPPAGLNTVAQSFEVGPFLRRIRNMLGGLISWTNYHYDKTSTMTLSHETVRSFVRRSHWLLIHSQHIIPAEAEGGLWLYVLCRSAKTVTDAVKDISVPKESEDTPVSWSDLQVINHLTSEMYAIKISDDREYVVDVNFDDIASIVDADTINRIDRIHGSATCRACGRLSADLSEAFHRVDAALAWMLLHAPLEFVKAWLTRYNVDVNTADGAALSALLMQAAELDHHEDVLELVNVLYCHGLRVFPVNIETAIRGLSLQNTYLRHFWLQSGSYTKFILTSIFGSMGYCQQLRASTALLDVIGECPHLLNYGSAQIQDALLALLTHVGFVINLRNLAGMSCLDIIVMDDISTRHSITPSDCLPMEPHLKSWLKAGADPNAGGSGSMSLLARVFEWVERERQPGGLYVKKLYLRALIFDGVPVDWENTSHCGLSLETIEASVGPFHNEKEFSLS